MNRFEDFTAQLAIVMVERSPLNVLRLQSIPIVNQFLPGFFQARANFGRNTTAIDHCLKVAQQVSPAVDEPRYGNARPHGKQYRQLPNDALPTAGLSVSYFQLIQVLKYTGDHSLAESPKTTQQCDDCHDSRPKAPAWQGRWQLPSTAMLAVRTLKRVDLVFRDNRRNRLEVRDLMAFGVRVVTAEFRTAITARPGTMMYHLVTRFRRNQ
ncbi:MAG UNVERIFIED_CONTAM: hypothetical protein LVR18_34350 [Planctomycetaceae bacterium]